MMKDMRKFALAVPVLTAAVYGLRRALYATALDEKNLLIAGHPLELGLWAMVLLGALLVLGIVWKLDGINEYEENFKPSFAAGAAYLLLALVIGKMVLFNDFQGMERIAIAQRALGAAAVPALVWGSICRIRGKKPLFLIHALLCVFLLLYLISWYQSWSGNPQLQDYVFDLLAAVALILFSYHCAAFEAGMGNRRLQITMGLLAVLLCGGALAGSVNHDLYAAGLLWAAADLCRLAPPPKKDEVEAHDPS